jgi:hypothetical protein
VKKFRESGVMGMIMEGMEGKEESSNMLAVFGLERVHFVVTRTRRSE